VVVEIVDLEAGGEGTIDLRRELRADLAEIGLGGKKLGLAGVEVAVLVHQTRHPRGSQHRAPAVVPPLRIEDQMDADTHLRLIAQDLGRLQEPGTGDHQRGGERHAGGEQLARRQVHRVAHADVVATDGQLDGRLLGRFSGHRDER
jgi:hypothetical protein